MKQLDLFTQIVSRPFDYVRAWKNETGNRVIGHFCSYTPEEIICAAGALPFRIFGSNYNLSLADSHLQPYSCGLVRGALGDGLSGEMAFLDGVVFPHTCDSIQRLSDIWRMNVKHGFHLDLVLPVKLNTDAARDYMADVFRKFANDLQRALDIEIDDKDLRNGVETINRIRRRLKRLYEIRSEDPAKLSSADLLTVLKGSMMMDRPALVEHLDELVRFFDKAFDKTGDDPAASKKQERKRLVVTGGICSMPDILDIVEESGGAIVWDDLCTGARYFDAVVESAGDIIASIAKRYLERIVCPAKHSGLYSRSEHIVKMVKEHRAEGVIFLYLKFCDPHLFDYPYINEALEQAGIPSMMFEVETRLPSKEQFKTRCEAFMEML
jgi:bzd-type benzoyl-CoA reductase N subunit